MNMGFKCRSWKWRSSDDSGGLRVATAVHQHFKSKGVGLHLQEAVTAFRPVEGGIDVVLKSGLVLRVDMVVLSIGYGRM